MKENQKLVFGQTDGRVVSIENFEDVINHAWHAGVDTVILREDGTVQYFLDAYDAACRVGIRLVYGVIVRLEDGNASFYATLLMKDPEGLNLLYRMITENAVSGKKNPYVFSREWIDANRTHFLVGATAGKNELEYALYRNSSNATVMKKAAFYDFIETDDESLLLSYAVNGCLFANENFPLVWVGEKCAKPSAQECGCDGEEKLYEMLKKTTSFPPIATDTKKTQADFFRLKQMAFSEFYRVYGNGRKEAWRRLEEELTIISQLGCADYFLAANCLVQIAKRRGIPVRGSIGGGISIVAFLLGIVEKDPMLHGWNRIPITLIYGASRDERPTISINLPPENIDDVTDEAARSDGMTFANEGAYRERCFCLSGAIPKIRNDIGIQKNRLVTPFSAEKLWKYGAELVLLRNANLSAVSFMQHKTGVIFRENHPFSRCVIDQSDVFVDWQNHWKLFSETGIWPKNKEMWMRYYAMCAGEGIPISVMREDLTWLPVTLEEVYGSLIDRGFSEKDGCCAVHSLRSGNGFPVYLLKTVPSGMEEYFQNLMRCVSRMEAEEEFHMACALSEYQLRFPNEFAQCPVFQ